VAPAHFGVTIVVMFLVRQMSPCRPMSWLAGGADKEHADSWTRDRTDRIPTNHQ
jgi:hypothetical protein